METHVKVLGVLNIVCGALGIASALLLAVIFGGAAAVVGASGDADAAVAIPFIGITGMALVAFLTVWSLPGVIIGIGLYRLRPWARVPGIVVAIMALVAIPFGTILGAYGLWVLFSKETETLFTTQPIAT